MIPSPDGIFHYWLLMRWGLLLLAVVLISYHFAIHYLHERAKVVTAMAKLANASENSSLWEAPKEMLEARTGAKQAGPQSESRVSKEPAGKAGANTNLRRAGGLTPGVPCARSSTKGSDAPATSVECWRTIRALLSQKRSF